MSTIASQHDSTRLHELGHGSISKLLWNYSIPAVVGMLVMSLYNVIDRIFIGQGVGPEAIAGLTITFPVMNLSAALGVLIGAGASARVSIMLGAANHKGALTVLGNSLVLSVGIAAVYISCFGIFLDDILMAFGANEVTLPYARDFMIFILPGMFIMNISFSFNNIMRASGYPKRAMVTMFIGAGANLVLAPLFIFVFGWGIKGAAIATDIAMTISAVFVMAHFVRPGSVLHFTRGTFRLQWSIVWSVITIGAAPSLVNFAASVINAISNNSLLRYAGPLATEAIAAAGILTTFTSLLVMVIVGMCQGMQPIVGYNYGAGLYHRLKRAYWLTCLWASVICCAGTFVAMMWPQYIARMFSPDPQLISVTSNAILISTHAFWVVGFQVVSTNFMQSIGKATLSIVLSLSRQVIFLIPLLLLLPPYFGLNGIWYSFPCADTLATLVTASIIVWQMRAISKVAKKIAPR